MATSMRSFADLPSTLSPPALGRPVRVLLVRHAQSENRGPKKRVRPSPDPALSTLGYSQAEALTHKLVRDLGTEKNNVFVMSSPMQRCLLTITPTVRRLGLPLDRCLCHGAFYEFGCVGMKFTGRLLDDILEQFPQFTPAGFLPNGRWDYRGENEREDESECRARGERLAQFLHSQAQALTSSEKSPIIVFCMHQTISDLLCQLLLEGTGESWSYTSPKYTLHNTGVTELLLRPDGKATLENRDDWAHAVMCGRYP